MDHKIKVSSGVPQLDHLLDSLFIGDNVVWHDDAGSLAAMFCLNFLQTSQTQNKPVIYITFDRSPRNLIEKLGPLSEYPALTILDCFTCGKGAGSSVFLKFYEDRESQRSCQVIMVDDPKRMERVIESLYNLHAPMKDDVRLVFESLTGMADLWGGEDQVLQFYSHSCPRLYELNTVAYWIMEKKAHSSRFRAQINQIAQVAIELSIKRGTTSLMILKAEKRDLGNLQKPHPYWVKEKVITFDSEKRIGSGIDLGQRIKEIRTKTGLSQTELAHLVGVTPSTISQIESNMIYPSLPGLVKMAEILSVEVSAFFQGKSTKRKRLIFSLQEASPVKFPEFPEGSIQGKLLTSLDLEAKAEPFLIEIPPRTTLSSHFFIHKGEEMGYLLSGELEIKFKKGMYVLKSGELIALTLEVPVEWKNSGTESARMLWIKIK